ncbi:hypothetical protein LOTGIDRAFT_224731 [Lottia gigantea]|uniref:BPTI/Kunitz inhibitor domain-containing protein n=1 Tax=Lottia gigantea TaxID=225164 RepID=V4B4Z5_LOTGI|nr:hypothetical protein LOTGIDRAFT_224731 [Lottia gigantea]ESP02566.1 hypothetical protein LOTGIDRAFT_224731 [Lottia gigantea]
MSRNNYFCKMFLFSLLILLSFHGSFGHNCNLPIDRGICDNRDYDYSKVQFGWNAEVGRCDMFSYSGCRGNENRFSTRNDCLEICGPERECMEPMVAGNCTEIQERYYFNKLSGMCEVFVYSGCQRNGNNFHSMYDCLKKCKPHHSHCYLEPHQGDGSKIEMRYYYDPAHDTCYRLDYSGMGGNENNFYDFRSCIRECALENRQL